MSHTAPTQFRRVINPAHIQRFACEARKRAAAAHLTQNLEMKVARSKWGGLTVTSRRQCELPPKAAARPTKSSTGSAARRRPEARPAEPDAQQGNQKSQRAARPTKRQRYTTSRDGSLRRAVSDHHRGTALFRKISRTVALHRQRTAPRRQIPTNGLCGDPSTRRRQTTAPGAPRQESIP